MPVNVKIPTQLRAATEGEAVAVVEGATVAEVLDALYERFGELKARIADDEVCAGSSTSTWAVRTSASSRVSRHRSPTALRSRSCRLSPGRRWAAVSGRRIRGPNE